MEDFHGSVSFVAVGEDNATSMAIINSLYNHALLVMQRQIVTIPEASQELMGFANETPRVLVQLAEVIANALSVTKLNCH